MNKTLLVASLLATSLPCAANQAAPVTNQAIQYTVSVEECREPLNAKVGNCEILGSVLVVDANHKTKINSRSVIKRIIGTTEDNAIRETLTTSITAKSISFNQHNQATVAHVSVDIDSHQDDMNSGIRNSTPLSANYAISIPKVSGDKTEAQNILKITSSYWLRIKQSTPTHQ